MFKRLAATVALAAAGFLTLAAPASADVDHNVTVTDTTSTGVDAGHLLDLTASVFVHLGLL
jgi:hypothetical protein